jgi:PAS domain S-box-containing protein
LKSFKLLPLAAGGAIHVVLWARKSQPDTQLFRDVFNASPIGIAVETFDGQPLFVNPAFCSFLGFSEQELRHKHCVDFSPPEDAEKDWALFQQLREGSIDHHQLEKRYFRRDGSLVCRRLNISLLSSRPSPLVIAMVEDITDKKASLDREHDLLETLNFVTKQMAAAVSRCSHDLRYLWINQAYADWLQRPSDEIVGRPMSQVLGRAAFDALLPYFHRVLDGETVQYEQETNFHGIGKRWTSATYTPTLAADGTANGWVAVVLDITNRKLAENALLEVNRTLEVQGAQLQSREELLKVFVKNVPAGVAMFDRDMHYLQVSDRWCADYSVDSSQVLGRTQYDVFPDIPERWREMHRRGLEGETLRADEDRLHVVRNLSRLLS